MGVCGNTGDVSVGDCDVDCGVVGDVGDVGDVWAAGVVRVVDINACGAVCGVVCRVVCDVVCGEVSSVVCGVVCGGWPKLRPESSESFS